MFQIVKMSKYQNSEISVVFFSLVIVNNYGSDGNIVVKGYTSAAQPDFLILCAQKKAFFLIDNF